MCELFPWVDGRRLDGRGDGQWMDVVHGKGTSTRARSKALPKSGRNFPLSRDAPKPSDLVTSIRKLDRLIVRDEIREIKSHTCHGI